MSEESRRSRPALLTLAPDPAAVRVARRFVATVCTTASTCGAVLEVAVLLTSEVVTSALIHGRSEARLAVTAGTDFVRVEVADDNSRHSRPVEQDADALDGRGMRIVELLAQRWGVRDDRYGKTVWFELRSGAG